MSRDQIAEVIAREVVGVKFAKLFANKSEWTRARGLRDGQPVEVNEPRQCDILAAADAILALDEWQTVDSAPRDEHVLLYARMQPHNELTVLGPVIVSGYWDGVDESWCGSSSTWSGPFYTPTAWRPLPPAPTGEG